MFKLKKEQMLGVKLFTSILLILILFESNAQKINGNYESGNSIQKKEYFFNDGYRFSTISSGAFDHGSTFAKGHYILSEDTLFMFYDSLAIPYELSSYQIIGQDRIKKNGQQSAIISLSVLDENKNPLKGTTVILYKNDAILAVYPQSSDAEYYIQTEGKIATHIRVIESQTLDIPLKDLWNFNTKMEVVLAPYSNNRYSQKYKTEKYLIKEFQKNKLVLYDLTSMKQILLNKVK